MGFCHPNNPKIDYVLLSSSSNHSYDDNLYSLLHGYSELKIVHGQLKQMSIGQPLAPLQPPVEGPPSFHIFTEILIIDFACLKLPIRGGHTNVEKKILLFLVADRTGS